MKEDHIHDELPSSYTGIFLKVLPLSLNSFIDVLPNTFGLVLFGITNEPLY